MRTLSGHLGWDATLNARENNLNFLKEWKEINCYYSTRSNFSKDHRDKTEVSDPLVVEDPISYKLNDIYLYTNIDYTVMGYMFSVTPWRRKAVPSEILENISITAL